MEIEIIMRAPSGQNGPLDCARGSEFADLSTPKDSGSKE
jgi:hypothetical protein